MVCWHPKGEVLVSCSYDDSIKVWVEDDGEWECAQTLAGPGLGHSSTVWGVAFDASGQRMVSCSDDLTLKIWACHFDNPGMQPAKITSALCPQCQFCFLGVHMCCISIVKLHAFGTMSHCKAKVTALLCIL